MTPSKIVEKHKHQINCTTSNKMKAALPNCAKSLVMITVWIRVRPPPPPCCLSPMSTPVGFSFKQGNPWELLGGSKLLLLVLVVVVEVEGWFRRCCCHTRLKKKTASRVGLVGEAEFERRRHGPSQYTGLSVSHLETSRAWGESHKKVLRSIFPVQRQPG